MPAKSLQIVVQRPGTAMEPPSGLGPDGQTLWRDVLRDFDIEDAASLTVLRHACEAQDRAEALKQEARRDGLTVPLAAGGCKAHPALQAEAAARNLVVRFLGRLGVLDEAKRDRPGRPPGRGAA